MSNTLLITMVVNLTPRTTNAYLDLEFYELYIQYMNRQRQKITVRGRLTAEEDRRLDEIDSEVEYYQSCIDELYTLKNNI
jgi:hypothetical protein